VFKQPQKFTLITSLSEFISVFKQPTLSVVFRGIIYCHLKSSSSSKFFQVMSSSSSFNNVNGPSASRGSKGPSRGVAPSAILPNVQVVLQAISLHQPTPSFKLSVSSELLRRRRIKKLNFSPTRVAVLSVFWLPRQHFMTQCVLSPSTSFLGLLTWS
jgi:hypothetical protein